MMRWVMLATAVGLFACDDGGSTTDPRGGGGEGGAGGAADMGGMGGMGGAPDMRVPIPAMIAITAPGNGDIVAGPFVDVTGTYTGPESAITVNGEPAMLDGDVFNARVLLDGGEQEIVASGGGEEARITVQVDAQPPRIDIQSPIRGTWTEDAQIDFLFRITDDAGLARVTFDGDREVDTGLGPDFALTGLPLAAGLNILRLEAFDVPGNYAREHVTILQGPLQDADVAIPGALRLHVGTAGLDSLEQVALRLLSEQDFTQLVPNPLFEEGPFRAEITDIRYERASFELTPSAGELDVTIRLDELVLVMGLQIGEQEVYEIGAGAGAVTITGRITPRVRDGEIFIPLQDLEVLFTDLQVQPGDVPRFAENPEEGQSLIEEIAGLTVQVLAERYIPQLVDDLLGRIDEPIDLELLGATLQIQFTPDVIVVSERGLSIRLDAGVVFLGERPPGASLPGYVGTRQRWDGVPETDAIGIAVDDDLLNLVLYQIWRTGVLLPRLDSMTDLGGQQVLISNVLGNLVRRAYPDLDPSTPIALETRLPLPPVVKVQKAGGAVGLDIGIGDMDLKILTDNAAAMPLVNGAATLQLSTSLGVVQNEETGAIQLDLTVNETIGLFDVIDEVLRGAAENEMEEPVNNLLGVAGNIVPTLLSDLEIPALDIVTFTNLRTDVSGPDGTFITIFGDVE